jgi:hypothetical protein
MSKLRKELSEDPLSLFVSSAEAEDLSNRAKQSAAIVSQKYAQTMSRIGASASDLFAENLSFGDPLSRLPNPLSSAKSPQRDNENDQQSRQTRTSAHSRENFNMSPLKQSTTGDFLFYFGSRSFRHIKQQRCSLQIYSR